MLFELVNYLSIPVFCVLVFLAILLSKFVSNLCAISLLYVILSLFFLVKFLVNLWYDMGVVSFYFFVSFRDGVSNPRSDTIDFACLAFAIV